MSKVTGHLDSLKKKPVVKTTTPKKTGSTPPPSKDGPSTEEEVKLKTATDLGSFYLRQLIHLDELTKVNMRVSLSPPDKAKLYLTSTDKETGVFHLDPVLVNMPVFKHLKHGLVRLKASFVLQAHTTLPLEFKTQIGYVSKPSETVVGKDLPTLRFRAIRDEDVSFWFESAPAIEEVEEEESDTKIEESAPEVEDEEP